MRKFILFVLMIPIVSSCDPVSSMDANIMNSTSQKISVLFVSSDVSLNKVLLLDPDSVMLFQEGFSTTGSVLAPSLVEYDSVYIRNDSNEILKVFKAITIGKNIYNVDNDWMFKEPSKRYYKYDYEINDEDIN